MALAPRFYQVAAIGAVCEAGLGTLDTSEDAVIVPDPALAYGMTDLSGRDVDQFPAGLDWASQSEGIHCPGPVRYRLNDATVHGPEGVVTTGRYVVAETLHHVFPEAARAWRDGPLWLQLNQFTATRLEVGEHLLTGPSHNYYHWLLDGLARWSLTPPDGPCLLPWSGFRFQQEGPLLLDGLQGRALTIGPGHAVAVSRLGWSQPLTTFGTAFHPVLRQFGAAMRGYAGSQPIHDIYVLRDDAAHRPLRNEAEVVRLCIGAGFTPVRMSFLPMREQVALFAAARRIVAPHGAGLANLVFCPDGCAVLELHMDRYVNWCFRRLAATMRVRYGCLIGTAEPGGEDPHQRGWSIDLDRLSDALAEPAFMEC